MRCLSRRSLEAVVVVRWAGRKAILPPLHFRLFRGFFIGGTHIGLTSLHLTGCGGVLWFVLHFHNREDEPQTRMVRFHFYY